MPQFSPGEVKTAIAPMTNPTGRGFNYTAELYLGLPKVASSGVISFNLAAGETRNISFPVTMPSAEGTYPVYLDVFVGDKLIGAYQSTEDVIIVRVAPVEYVGAIEGVSMGVITPEGENISNRTAFGVRWRVYNPASQTQRVATTMDVKYRYKYTWYPEGDWSVVNTVEPFCMSRPPAYQPTKDRWVITQIRYLEPVYGWQPYCDWAEEFAYPYGIGLICSYPFVVDIPPGETITIDIPIFMQARENYYYRVRLHSEAGDLESGEFIGRRHG